MTKQFILTEEVAKRINASYIKRKESFQGNIANYQEQLSKVDGKKEYEEYAQSLRDKIVKARIIMASYQEIIDATGGEN